MRMFKKVFGIGLGLAVLMMAGTITAFASESEPVVKQEIAVQDVQPSGQALDELLDELESKGIPAENISVNGNTVAVLKEAPSSPRQRGLIDYWFNPYIIELWDVSNSRIWIGDLNVYFNAVYDGTYVAIGYVDMYVGEKPRKSTLQIDNYNYYPIKDGAEKASIEIPYSYEADDGEAYKSSVYLNVFGDGSISISDTLE